ncbi:hypothetical protein GCM10010468_66810 [Actinocorallia longicatena]|uniref:Uncharacterized protein n=1 Tax=Actinocorallia longicatena TaxID=111803 RepID=A0ABP6QKY3_9ACTN
MTTVRAVQENRAVFTGASIRGVGGLIVTRMTPGGNRTARKFRVNFSPPAEGRARA